MVKRTKILIVEDDLALRKQISFAFENNFNIIEAQDRKEAIKILEKNEVSLVILDLGLPPYEDSPIEGLKILDYINEYLNVKVVVLTGQKEEKATIESIKRGAFDYLPKPIEMEKLLYSIERALLYESIEKKLEEKENIKKISLNVEMGKGLKFLKDEIEKKLIFRLLKKTNFNIYRVSKILGISRQNLYYLLRKFGLERENVRDNN